MTVVAASLAIAIIGAIAAIVALALALRNETQRRAADAKLLTDERVAHTATSGKLERTEFQLNAQSNALAEAERKIDLLAKEPDADPNADLAPDDVDARSVRAAIKAKAAAARRGGAPAASDAAPVHSPRAADAGGTAAVSPAGPLDPDESLL